MTTIDSTKNWNLDSDTGFFFKRELEQIRSKTYDIKKVPLKAREIFPMDFEIDEGTEYVVYQTYDQVGQARVIANYATDLPRVDVRGEEFQSRVKGLGAAYGYSVQDIRSARKAGKPLEARKASAARKSIAIEENAIAFHGSKSHNIQGFFDNANIPRIVSPDNGSGSGLWALKSADQILADLHLLGNNASDLTDDVEVADTICLPTKQYNLIHSLKMSQYDTRTVAQAFLEATPHINSILAVSECKAAGYLDEDLAFSYRKDADALQMVVPMDFLQHAAQQKGLEFEIPCEERFGGVVVYYPMSITFMEGV